MVHGDWLSPCCGNTRRECHRLLPPAVDARYSSLVDQSKQERLYQSVNRGTDSMKVRTAAILMVLFGCSTALFSQRPATQDTGPPALVSLIRVIANPKDFHGQPIRVVGFLGRGGGLDKGGVGLFVSEFDSRNFIIPNSIDLHVDESMVTSLMGRYIALSGTYHAPARLGYNGYIDQIVEVSPLRPGK